MRSVLVSKFVPWPPNSGEKRRTLAIARALLSLGDVTICGFVGRDEQVEALEREGFEVRGVPLRRSWAKTLPGLLRGRSLSAARFWDPALARAVRGATDSRPDVVLTHHVQFQMYTASSTPRFRVVDMHNIESALSRRMARARKGLLGFVYAVDAVALKRLERRSGSADLVLVASRADQETLAGFSSQGTVVVVPNGWDPSEALPAATGPVVSFVALLSWGPNVDAALWFGRSVWPLVQAGRPDATLQFVGRDPHADIRALASDHVVVTGTVDDLEPWYAATSVAVAPLLAGGGSRLKILEALSMARPVVATTIGVEGLEDLVGDGVVVADDAAETAERILELLDDPDRAEDLGAKGALAVAERHSWQAAVAPLVRGIHEALATGVAE